jgi:hypothetical protein
MHALITDISGRTIQQSYIQSDPAILDIQTLKNGVYLLILTTETGIRKTIKFIKM